MTKLPLLIASAVVGASILGCSHSEDTNEVNKYGVRHLDSSSYEEAALEHERAVKEAELRFMEENPGAELVSEDFESEPVIVESDWDDSTEYDGVSPRACNSRHKTILSLYYWNSLRSSKVVSTVWASARLIDNCGKTVRSKEGEIYLAGEKNNGKRVSRFVRGNSYYAGLSTSYSSTSGQARWDNSLCGAYAKFQQFYYNPKPGTVTARKGCW